MCANILASRCLVSFVPFSARFGFALRAFNLFAPSPCMSMCIWVCVFASLCVCQLLILYKHTHACALAHTLTHIGGDGKRGTLRRWVEERQRKRERERERKKITLYYWHTRWLLCCLLDICLLEANAFSHFVPFRWWQWWRPVEWHFYVVTPTWFFFLLYLSFTGCVALFFSYLDKNYYSSYRFHCYNINMSIYIYVCVCECVCVCASPETVKMCHASLP